MDKSKESSKTKKRLKIPQRKSRQEKTEKRIRLKNKNSSNKPKKQNIEEKRVGSTLSESDSDRFTPFVSDSEREGGSRGEGKAESQICNIAYRDRGVWVTYPFIDKITIVGTPPQITSKIKEHIEKELFASCKRSSKANSLSFYVEQVDKDDLKGSTTNWYNKYQYHFRVKPLDCETFVLLSIAPIGKNAPKNFLRMEFNPNKMGPDNVRKFISWYNQLLDGHSRFKDIVSTSKCIRRVDVAIDIIGVHIADLILNKNQGKMQCWHSENGVLETVYFDAKPKGRSKLKAYNKVKAHHLSADYPVTRVEASVFEGSTKPFYELYSLMNHFKNLKIYTKKEHPYFEELMPAGEDHYSLVLDSVRFRGQNNALERLPDDLAKKYPQLLKQGLGNIFASYNERAFWCSCWREYLDGCGLLSDFEDQ